MTNSTDPFQQVPAELKALPQWVCWRLEPDPKKPEKPRKVPVNPKNGRLASHSDSLTWATYQAAVSHLQRDKTLSGIGYVFSENDPYCGTDLDAVIDPQTGEIDPEALAEIKALDSYTETSPSGTGAHVLTKATLNGGGHKKNNREVYDKQRFFTMTGKPFNDTRTTIEERQSVIDQLCAKWFGTTQEAKAEPPPHPAPDLSLTDAELIEKACRAKNGADLQALRRGDTARYGNDHSRADLTLCSCLLFWTGSDVTRADQLFRQSGLMRPKWNKRHSSDGRTYEDMTMDKASASVTNFYKAKQHQDKARSETPEQEIPPLDVEPIMLPTVSPCTHLANSHRIRHCYKGQIWYALGLGWIMWTGQFWRADPTSEGSIATGFVAGLSRLIAKESSIVSRRAADEAGEDRRKSLMAQAETLLKWAVQSENERTMAAGLKLTKHALLVEYGDINADPWLFNVQNGTIDLRTGTLRPHDPSDLITFISPVTYDPTATCPTWERFLSEVFAGDVDMVAFVQRAVGWSLTGVVKERALFFLYGDTGKNGKTTMVEAIMKLIGNCTESSYGYGRKVGADTFMKSKNHEDNQRKAATLAGPRFICTSEVDEEHRLNEQLIKDITGGDTIEGRRLYQEAFTFKPQFKPWMYGNHKPEIRGTDDAIWSRVRLVPFEVSFKGREDLELADKLEAELSGILNWAIRGCLDWQRTGLQPPAKVRAATQAYREEMDVFGPFIRECCVIHRGAEARAKDLWNAYKAWCAENSVAEQNQTKFGRYLTSKGWKSEGSKPVKRIGIGLLDKHHSDSSDSSDSYPENPYKESPIGEFLENPRQLSEPSEKPPKGSGKVRI